MGTVTPSALCQSEWEGLRGTRSLSTYWRTTCRRTIETGGASLIAGAW